MTEREFIEASLRMRTPDEASAKRLAAFNEAQADWYATCQKCKTDLHGTLAQIKAHRCGSTS